MEKLEKFILLTFENKYNLQTVFLIAMILLFFVMILFGISYPFFILFGIYVIFLMLKYYIYKLLIYRKLKKEKNEIFYKEKRNIT